MTFLSQRLNHHRDANLDLRHLGHGEHIVKYRGSRDLLQFGDPLEESRLRPAAADQDDAENDRDDDRSGRARAGEGGGDRAESGPLESRPAQAKWAWPGESPEPPLTGLGLQAVVDAGPEGVHLEPILVPAERIESRACLRDRVHRGVDFAGRLRVCFASQELVERVEVLRGRDVCHGSRLRNTRGDVPGRNALF